MKILFICKGNIGRSVFAEALYNKLTKTRDAYSAGTKVVYDGKTLASIMPIPEHVLAVMKEDNLDVSSRVMTQLTSDMVSFADVIVDMAEPETVPLFVKDHPKRIIWSVENPKGTDFETHQRIRDQIKDLIKILSRSGILSL